MALTYQTKRITPEKWGIDITCDFTDNVTGEIKTIQFGFKDQKDIDNNFNVRMLKAIENIEAEKVVAVVPTAEEILKTMEIELTKAGSISLQKFNDIKNPLDIKPIVGPIIEEVL